MRKEPPTGSELGKPGRKRQLMDELWKIGEEIRAHGDSSELLQRRDRLWCELGDEINYEKYGVLPFNLTACAPKAATVSPGKSTHPHKSD